MEWDIFNKKFLIVIIGAFVSVDSLSQGNFQNMDIFITDRHTVYGDETVMFTLIIFEHENTQDQKLILTDKKCI